MYYSESIHTTHTYTQFIREPVENIERILPIMFVNVQFIDYKIFDFYDSLGTVKRKTPEKKHISVQCDECYDILQFYNVLFFRLVWLLRVLDVYLYDYNVHYIISCKGKKEFFRHTILVTYTQLSVNLRVFKDN